LIRLENETSDFSEKKEFYRENKSFTRIFNNQTIIVKYHVVNK